MRTTDAELRLKRARSHLDDALTLLKEWMTTGGYVWQYVEDPDLAVSAWVLVVNRPIPELFPVLIADFYSNAMAALDYLAWAAFLEGGGNPKERIYFPIVAPEKSWHNTKKVPKASEGFLAIVESEQDVPPENLLFMIGVMNNPGKHQALHLAALSTDGHTSMQMPLVPDGLSLGMEIGAQLLPMPDFGPLVVSRYYLFQEGDATLSVVPRPPTFQFEQPALPERSFVISDGSNHMALGLLEHQLDRVERIVNRVRDELP
jgi:hypothetical protein